MRLRLGQVLGSGFLFILFTLAVAFHFLDWPRIEAILNSIPYRCPLKLFTGFECAFCGMTHSWIAILRGDWAQAIHFNLLGPIVFAGSVFTAIAIIANVNLEKRIKPWMGVVALLVLAIYTVARNF